MFTSKLETNHKSRLVLEKELETFVNKNKTVYCKALRKNIYLDKLPEVIIRRNSSARRRLQKFNVAIDVLKGTKKFEKRLNDKNEVEYEITGISANKKVVKIHLREEINNKKDRKVYFISCL